MFPQAGRLQGLAVCLVPSGHSRILRSVWERQGALVVDVS